MAAPTGAKALADHCVIFVSQSCLKAPKPDEAVDGPLACCIAEDDVWDHFEAKCLAVKSYMFQCDSDLNSEGPSLSAGPLLTFGKGGIRTLVSTLKY